MRRFYILLLHMHPAMFKRRFGDEMLWIFDQSPEKVSLLGDGVQSLFRQWALRRGEVAKFPVTIAADGVPLFYSGPPDSPRSGALMRGAMIALLFFAAIAFGVSHRWKQGPLIVGSHHPSPSHLLPVKTEAKPIEDLPSEVKVKPYRTHPPVSPYFELILVLGALDTDQDNMISASEMDNAASALWTLDKNHDNKLSAEECGLKPDPKLTALGLGRARLNFMHLHPVLTALDANQDGVISELEIRNAPRALRTLDANRDGKLVLAELLPDRAIAMAVGIMEMFDCNGDGKITRDEKPADFADGLLDRADHDGKGFVTEDDLAKELIRRGKP